MEKDGSNIKRVMLYQVSIIDCNAMLKHGPQASVTTNTSAYGLGFVYLILSGHIFNIAHHD